MEFLPSKCIMLQEAKATFPLGGVKNLPNPQNLETNQSNKSQSNLSSPPRIKSKARLKHPLKCITLQEESQTSPLDDELFKLGQNLILNDHIELSIKISFGEVLHWSGEVFLSTRRTSHLNILNPLRKIGIFRFPSNHTFFLLICILLHFPYTHLYSFSISDPPSFSNPQLYTLSLFLWNLVDSQCKHPFDIWGSLQSFLYKWPLWSGRNHIRSECSHIRYRIYSFKFHSGLQPFQKEDSIIRSCHFCIFHIRE